MNIIQITIIEVLKHLPGAHSQLKHAGKTSKGSPKVAYVATPLSHTGVQAEVAKEYLIKSAKEVFPNNRIKVEPNGVAILLRDEGPEGFDQNVLNKFKKFVSAESGIAETNLIALIDHNFGDPQLRVEMPEYREHGSVDNPGENVVSVLDAVYEHRKPEMDAIVEEKGLKDVIGGETDWTHKIYTASSWGSRADPLEAKNKEISLDAVERYNWNAKNRANRKLVGVEEDYKPEYKPGDEYEQ